MDQEQLETILGCSLFDFISAEDKKPYKGGFLKMPQDYRHGEIEHQIEQLGIETKIRFKPGTHSQVLQLVLTTSSLNLPQHWCVPLPEDGEVFFFNSGDFCFLEVGEDGVHWKDFYKVFICFPVTDPIPCCS